MTDASAPIPRINLPRLRENITLEFNDYDLDGKPQWLLYDAGRNKYFIIGWIEYELLKYWKVGDSEELIKVVNAETTLHVEMTDVENLTKFLVSNYLIQQSGYSIHRQAKDQKLFQDENKLQWLINYYLFFRIPLLHPDKFLTRTKRVAEFAFNRYFAYFMLFLAVISLYQLSTQWERFTHTFASIISWQGLIAYFFAFSICKFFHELGHAYMCKRFDVPVPSLGVAFLVFWPVLYTDTNASWRLKSWQRLRIAVAGMWIESYVVIIAALLWCNTSNATLQTICYVTITVNWLSSLLINVSPFMRFDGYYVLTDLLRMPNLQTRAFALTRWQIRRWLFDWPDPPPEKFSVKMHAFLVCYSLVTWIYRLILYFGIAVLVYHFFIKILGIILFSIELFYFILRPFVSEFYTWIALRDKFTWNRHTVASAIVVVLLTVLFFLPISVSVHLPATISYQHQFLFVNAESILKSELPPLGSVVKANQVVATFVSPDLEYSVKRVQIQYNKSLAELRRTRLGAKYTQQNNILLSEINKQKSLLQKLADLENQLILKAPFDGIVIDENTDLSPGTYAEKNAWVADIANPDSIQIEGYLSQIDVKRIHVGSKGHFYPHDLSEPARPVTVESIQILNSNYLACHYSTALRQDRASSMVVETPCYHSTDFGGDIRTMVNSDGNYVPIETVYRIVLKTENKVTLDRIQRGTVFLRGSSRSYAYRFFYRLKSLIVEQSEF